MFMPRCLAEIFMLKLIYSGKFFKSLSCFFVILQVPINRMSFRELHNSLAASQKREDELEKELAKEQAKRKALKRALELAANRAQRRI